MSKVNPIPAGFHTATPVLVVKGAADAIEHYKEAFGAEEIERAASPDGKSIWHATIRIGDSMIMLNDEMPEMGVLASPVQVWLYLPDVDAAFARAVGAGAKVVMPVMDMFWGDRFGKVTDAWGISWGLAQRVKDMTPDEQRKAQAEFVAKMAAGKG